MLASALRTDPHCLRRLEPTDPAIIELREWSRLNEDLTRDRVRLANRMRDQLWRYYPQFLDAVDDDVAAPWALDLWRSLPTPRAGQRVREVTLTKVLKQHRIRRIDAATLRARLRAPAVKLAPGTGEAATTHVRLLAERLALVNRQLDHARRELDRLVHQLAVAAPADDPNASTEDEPSSREPPDTAILLSVPGIGTKVLATLLAEGNDAVGRRDYDALRMIVTRRQAAHDRLRDAAYHLGSRRCPTRSGQPRQVPVAPRPRPRSRARSALGGRPLAQRRLRDAPRRHPLRPAPCRDSGYVSRLPGPCSSAHGSRPGREGPAKRVDGRGRPCVVNAHRAKRGNLVTSVVPREWPQPHSPPRGWGWACHVAASTDRHQRSRTRWQHENAAWGRRKNRFRFFAKWVRWCSSISA